jgi:hypothetical protein
MNSGRTKDIHKNANNIELGAVDAIPSLLLGLSAINLNLAECDNPVGQNSF